MAYSKEEIDEKFDLIIRDIELQSMPIRRAIQGKGMPSLETFYKWIDEDEEKAKRYARACEARAENLFEEILEIADEKNADIALSDDGTMFVDGNAIQRSRLQIDARKWMLTKMQPKKYGDKIEQNLTGDVNVNFNIKDVVKFDNTKQ